MTTDFTTSKNYIVFDNKMTPFKKNEQVEFIETATDSLFKNRFFLFRNKDGISFYLEKGQVRNKPLQQTPTNAIGFIPINIEENIMLLSKKHNVLFKEVINIMNAMIDSNITKNDLSVKRIKSDFEDVIDQKTKAIWNKILPKYTGQLIGNRYYSPLREIILSMLVFEYKPFRKYQK